jgi:hypothetical protein
MRPVLIVIDPPRFNLLSGIVQRDEHLRIQALIAKLAVKAFNKRILHTFYKWRTKYAEPDCPNYSQIAPKNRIAFNSAAEAEAAWYRVVIEPIAKKHGYKAVRADLMSQPASITTQIVE